MVLFIEKTWLFWWVLALVAIARFYSPPLADPIEPDTGSTDRDEDRVHSKGIRSKSAASAD
jgi:hypothetical protein